MYQINPYRPSTESVGHYNTQQPQTLKAAGYFDTLHSISGYFTRSVVTVLGADRDVYGRAQEVACERMILE